MDTKNGPFTVPSLLRLGTKPSNALYTKYVGVVRWKILAFEPEQEEELFGSHSSVVSQ
jgi:hypothetical protein